MTTLIRQLTVITSVVAACLYCAAEETVVYTLVVPPTAAEAGTTVDVQLATLNRSTAVTSSVDPTIASATLIVTGARLPVTLQLRDNSTNVPTIAPGSFALRQYAMTIPPGAPAGLATLEVQLAGAGIARSAVAIGPPSSIASRAGEAATERPTSNLVRVQSVAQALGRNFANRAAPHEPVYFIAGPDDPVAKFQFSFKYKLLEFGQPTAQRMIRTFQFAYTQRSLWDLNEVSSPFYDTSYMPELMYQSLAPLPDKTGRSFNWLGLQAALKHESNGQAGPDSRSLNIVYARTVFAFGRLDGWHLLAIPEVFTYLGGSLQDNPDIADYRGYGKLSIVLGRNNGPSLTTMLWAGKEFDHVSAQLDLTFPIRTRLLNFEAYFLVQYFNGYGESLLSYRTHSETVRAGISLIR